MSGAQFAKAETQIYYEPGINLYRELASQDGIESIDPYTGMLKIRHVDLLVPGNGGLDIKITRTYDSAGVYQLGVGGMDLGAMGYGWLFHFGKLTGSYVCQPHLNTSATRPVFELPDGTQIKFLKAPAGFSHLYTSKEGWIADCANSPDGGGLIVVSPEGLRYEMTVRYSENGINFFQVRKITDRHGNWLDFEYQITGAKPYVTRCVASDGRQVSITYSPGMTSGNRVYQITANGQTWQYDYTSNGAPLSSYANASSFELAKVTRPDGSAWAYEYPTFPSYYSPFVIMKGYLAKVTRPEGGLTSYNYSYVSTAVLGGSPALRITKKTARDNLGPEATWDYRYKFFERVGNSSIGFSITDITGPSGDVTTYKHETPYASYTASAWRIGLLLEKLECSGGAATCDPAIALSHELNEWGSQVVSPDPYLGYTAVEPYIDSQTLRPLLTKRTVMRDGTSYATQYQLHDEYGNPARIVESGNGVNRTADRTYYNDTAKWIVGKLDRETIDGTWVTDRTFDTSGRITSVNKFGVITTYSYHPHGEIASVTDARGSQTTYSDYYRGVARQENQLAGVSLRRTVNPAGTIATETNGEGYVTRFTYDGLNRLKRVDPPVGNATEIEWRNPQWNSPALIKRITRGSFEETHTHDGFGRVIESVKLDTATHARVRRIFRYDGLGRKVVEYYPTSSTETMLTNFPRAEYSYDATGRLTQVRHADGKTRKLQFLVGNKVRVTNESGRVYDYTYRSLGDPEERELMDVVAPVAAANMTLTRNALGQITSFAQSGVTRTLLYDTRAYLSKVFHPEIGWVTYTRDALGNPLTKSVGVSPNTRTIGYTYDARNRLTNVSYPDATTPPVSLTYNRVDDVVSASRGGVTRTYAYDANRNLTDEALHLDGRVFSLRYDYDGNDATSYVTYPDGQVVSFRPDALGRPTEVAPYVSSIGYHPSGQVASMAYANGVSTTQAFNTRQWPQQMSVIAPAGVLLNTAYGYDGLGNVTAMVDGIDSSYNRTLTYDAIDRLITAAGPWGAGTLTYDGRGNLLSQQYGSSYSRSYTYDASNRLASYSGSTAFVYDAWGNATRSGSALSHHLFDDASNLYCASCDSANPIQFGYDANNYRVKKTRNGAVTYSLYAKDGNLMMEYSPSSGDLKQFSYHNKKQVAMRHIVDPTLTLGWVEPPGRNRLAAIPPAGDFNLVGGWLSGQLLSNTLLDALHLARAD